MDARPRSSLLWGLVGVLAFLVVAQGYRLLVGPLGFGVPVWVGVAVLVGLAAALTTYLLEPRVTGKGRT